MKKTNLFSNIFATVVICIICILCFGIEEVSAYSDITYEYYVDTNIEYNLITLMGYDPEGDYTYDSPRSGDVILTFDVPSNGFINIDDDYFKEISINNNGIIQKVDFNTNIPVNAGTNELHTYVDGYFFNGDDMFGPTYNGDFIISYKAADIIVETENNENFDNAAELGTETIYGFGAEKDIDTYHFTLENNSKVLINSNSSSNFELYSEDVNGNTSKITADINKNVRLSAGSYFVRIKHNRFNLYQISLSVTDESEGNFEVEDNDSEKLANEVTVDTAFTGSIVSKKDKDYFVFTPDTDCKVTLKTSVAREKANKLYSFTLYRYDSKGNKVNMDIFKSTSNPVIERKQFTATVGITYYLLVESGNKKYNSDIDYTFEFVSEKIEKEEVKEVEENKEVKIETAEKIIEVEEEADYELVIGETSILMIKKANKKVFESSNADIVTVNSKGKIKAIVAGTATITIRDKKTNKIIETYLISVISEEDEEADIELEVGDILKLPKFKGAKNVVSDDNDIVSIINGNKMSAISEGATSIHFLDSDDNIVETYTVLVR